MIGTMMTSMMTSHFN
ncbi:hypothetical protein RDABS01_019110 [Bienertia sinuspersici]